jgi:hypothetical protein
MEENVRGILQKVEAFTEESYKESKCMSYSIFKDVYNNPEVLTEEREDKKSEWLTFGTIVDMLLTESAETLDEKVVISDVVPSEQYKKMSEYIIDNGIDIDKITNEEILLAYGFAESKVNWGIEAKKKNLIENCSTYIKFIIDNRDKLVISSALFDEATLISNTFLTHRWCRDLFISETEQKKNDIEIIYQYKIKYVINDIVFKSKIDIVVINHKKKEIYLYDIKTGSDYPKAFVSSTVYNYRYIYQAVLYTVGLRSFLKDNNLLEDYTIEGFRFVYVSRIKPTYPLILDLDNDMLRSIYYYGVFNDRYDIPGIDNVTNAIKYFTNEIENGNTKLAPYDLEKNKGIIKLEPSLIEQLLFQENQ